MNVIEKIQKLIAHSKSAATIGNQAEAEAFAAKASRLLVEHKLSMSDVERDEEERDDPFGYEDVLNGYGCVPQWRMVLAGAIARSMFCSVLYRPGKNLIIFVGRGKDRRAAIDMYQYLAFTAKKLAKEELKKAKKEGRYNPAIKDIHWVQSYTLGFSVGIKERLLADFRVLEARPEGNALVLRSQVALRNYMDDVLRPRAGRSHSNHSISGDAYARGHAEGSKTVMHRRAALGDGN